MSIIEFTNKAYQHLYYLKLIMIFVMFLLNVIEFYDTKQFFVTGFIIMFNIAFTQNLILNVKCLKL